MRNTPGNFLKLISLISFLGSIATGAIPPVGRNVASVFLDASNPAASDQLCAPCATLAGALDAAIQIGLVERNRTAALPLVSVFASSAHREVGQHFSTTAALALALLSSEHTSFMKLQIRCMHKQLFRYFYVLHKTLLRLSGPSSAASCASVVLQYSQADYCISNSTLPCWTQAYDEILNSPLRISEEYGNSSAALLSDYMFWRSAAGAELEVSMFGRSSGDVGCVLPCGSSTVDGTGTYPVFHITGSKSATPPTSSPLQLLQAAGHDAWPAYNASCLAADLSSLVINSSFLIAQSGCNFQTWQCPDGLGPPQLISSDWASSSIAWAIGLAAETLKRQTPLGTQTPLIANYSNLPRPIEYLISDSGESACSSAVQETAGWVLGESPGLPAPAKFIVDDLRHTISRESGAINAGSWFLNSSRRARVGAASPQRTGFLQLVGWAMNCSVSSASASIAFPGGWNLLPERAIHASDGAIVSAGPSGTVCLAHCHVAGSSSQDAGLLVAHNQGSMVLSNVRLRGTKSNQPLASLLKARNGSSLIAHAMSAQEHVSSAGAHAVSADTSSLIVIANSNFSFFSSSGSSGAVLHCSRSSSCAVLKTSVRRASTTNSGGALAVSQASTLIVSEATLSFTMAASAATTADFAAWAGASIAGLTTGNLTELPVVLADIPRGGAVAVGTSPSSSEGGCVFLMSDSTVSNAFAPVGGAISVWGPQHVTAVVSSSVTGSPAHGTFTATPQEAQSLNYALLQSQLFPVIGGCLLLSGHASRCATVNTTFSRCTAQQAGGAAAIIGGGDVFFGEGTILVESTVAATGGGAVLGHGRLSTVLFAGVLIKQSKVLQRISGGSLIQLLPIVNFPDPHLGSVPIGGAIVLAGAYGFFSSSLITDSFAAAGGGAIAATRGAALTVMDSNITASRFEGKNVHGGAILVANSTLQLLGRSVVHDSAPDGGRSLQRGGVISSGVALYNKLELNEAIPASAPTLLALPACPCSDGSTPPWAAQIDGRVKSTLHEYSHGACEVDLYKFSSQNALDSGAGISPQISAAVNHDGTAIFLGAPAGLGVIGANRITINGSICVIRSEMRSGIESLFAATSSMSAGTALGLQLPLARQGISPDPMMQVSRDFSNIPTQPLLRTSLLNLSVFSDTGAELGAAHPTSDLLVAVQDTHFQSGRVSGPWGLIVTNNTAGSSGAGGGIGLRSFSLDPGSSTVPFARLTAEHLLVHNNSVTSDGGSGSFGAGIFVYGYASLQLRYTRISANKALGSAGAGGGLYTAHCSEWRHMWVHGVDITDNQASLLGGGWYIPGASAELQAFGNQCPKAVGSDRNNDFTVDGQPRLADAQRGMFGTKYSAQAVAAPSKLLQYQRDVHSPQVRVAPGLMVPAADGWPMPGNCSVLFENADAISSFFETQSCAKLNFLDVDLLRDGSDARLTFEGNKAGSSDGSTSTGAGGGLSVQFAVGFTAQLAGGLLPDLPLVSLLNSSRSLRVLSAIKLSDLRPAHWATVHGASPILTPSTVPDNLKKYRKHLMLDPLTIQGAWEMFNKTQGQVRVPALDRLDAWSPQHVLMDFTTLHEVFRKGFTASEGLNPREAIDKAVSEPQKHDFNRWVHSAMMHDSLSTTQERLLFAEASLLAWAPFHQWNVSHLQRRKLAAFFGSTVFSDRYTLFDQPEAGRIPSMLAFDEWLPLDNDGDIFESNPAFSPLSYRTRVVSMAIMSGSSRGAWPLLVAGAVFSENEAGQTAGGVSSIQSTLRFDGCLFKHHTAQSEGTIYSIESAVQLFNAFIEDGSATGRSVGGARFSGQLLPDLREVPISNSVFRRCSSISSASTLNLEEEAFMNYTIVSDGRGGGAAVQAQSRARDRVLYQVCTGCLITRCSSQIESSAGGMDFSTILEDGSKAGWGTSEMVFTVNWNSQQLGQGGALRCSAASRSNLGMFLLSMNNTVGAGNLAQSGGMAMFNTLCELKAHNFSCSYGTMVGSRRAQETFGESLGSCLFLFTPGPVGATLTGRVTVIGNENTAVSISSAEHFEVSGNSLFATNTVAQGFSLTQIDANLRGSLDFLLNGRSTLPSSIDCRAPGSTVMIHEAARLRFYAPALTSVSGAMRGHPMRFRAADGGSVMAENSCTIRVASNALVVGQALEIYARRVAFMTLRLNSAFLVESGATVILGGCQVEADVGCILIVQESIMRFEAKSTFIISNTQVRGNDSIAGAISVSGSGSSFQMQDALLFVTNASLIQQYPTERRSSEPINAPSQGGGFISASQRATIDIDITQAALLDGPPGIHHDILSGFLDREAICINYGQMCSGHVWAPGAWTMFLGVFTAVEIGGLMLPVQQRLSFGQVQVQLAQDYSERDLTGGIFHVNSGGQVHLGCRQCSTAARLSMNTSVLGRFEQPQFSMPTQISQQHQYVKPVVFASNCSVHGSGLLIGAVAAAAVQGDATRAAVSVQFVIIANSSATGGRGGGLVACESCNGLSVANVLASQVAVVRGGGAVSAYKSRDAFVHQVDVVSSIIGVGGGVVIVSNHEGVVDIALVSFTGGIVFGSGGVARITQAPSASLTTVCISSSELLPLPWPKSLADAGDLEQYVARGAVAFTDRLEHLIVDSVSSQQVVNAWNNATDEMQGVSHDQPFDYSSANHGNLTLPTPALSSCLARAVSSRGGHVATPEVLLGIAASSSQNNVTSEGGLWYLQDTNSIVCPSALRPRDVLSFSAMLALADSTPAASPEFEVQQSLRQLFRDLSSNANSSVLYGPANAALRILDAAAEACTVIASDVAVRGFTAHGRAFAGVGGGAVSQGGVMLLHNIHTRNITAQSSAGMRIRDCGAGAQSLFPAFVPRGSPLEGLQPAPVLRTADVSIQALGSCSISNIIIEDTVATCDRAGLDLQETRSSGPYVSATTVYGLSIANARAFREKGTEMSCISSSAPVFMDLHWPFAFGSAISAVTTYLDLCSGADETSTWYVDPTAVTDDRGGCCGSKTAPCQTISSAIANAADGGTISLAPAKYRIENLQTAGSVNSFNGAPLVLTGLELMREKLLMHVPAGWHNLHSAGSELWVPLPIPLLVSALPQHLNSIASALLDASAIQSGNILFASCESAESTFGPLAQILQDKPGSTGAAWVPASALELHVQAERGANLNISAEALFPMCQDHPGWDGWIIPLQQAHAELLDAGSNQSLLLTVERPGTVLSHLVFNSSEKPAIINATGHGFLLEQCVLASPSQSLLLRSAEAIVTRSVFLQQPHRAQEASSSIIQTDTFTALEMRQSFFVGDSSATRNENVRGGIVSVAGTSLKAHSIAALGISATSGGCFHATSEGIIDFSGSLVALQCMATDSPVAVFLPGIGSGRVDISQVQAWKQHFFISDRLDCDANKLAESNTGGFLSLSLGSTATFRLSGSMQLVHAGCARLGGVAYVSDGSILRIFDADIQPDRSSLALVLQRNVAFAGGALYTTSQSKLEIITSRKTAVLHVSYNSAVRGGGAFAERSLWIAHPRFHIDGFDEQVQSIRSEWANQAKSNPAALNSLCPVRTVDTELTPSMCSKIPATIHFLGNFASAEGGGMFLLTSILNATGLCVERNAASRGGGLASLLSTSAITDSAFISNAAVGNGGAGAFITSDTLQLQSVILQGNSGGGSGGGLSADLPSAAKLDRIIAVCNQAMNGDGGALHLAAATGLRVFLTGYSLFAGNAAGDSGGAVFLTSAAQNDDYSSSALILAASSIIDQDYQSMGALAVLQSWAAAGDSSADPSVVNANAMLRMALMSESTMLANKAARNGGALYCSLASVVFWSSATSQISFNSAEQGAALFLDRSCSALTGNLQLNKNAARQSGAAIQACSTCAYIASGVKITGNCATGFEQGRAASCPASQPALPVGTSSLRQGLKGTFAGSVYTSKGSCSLVYFQNSSISNNSAGGLFTGGETTPSAQCLSSVQAVLQSLAPRRRSLDAVLTHNTAQGRKAPSLRSLLPSILGRTSVWLPGTSIRGNLIPLRRTNEESTATQASGETISSILANLLWTGTLQPQAISWSAQPGTLPQVQPLSQALPGLDPTDPLAAIQLNAAQIKLYDSRDALATASSSQGGLLGISVDIPPGSTVPQSEAPRVVVLDSNGDPILQASPQAAGDQKLLIEISSLNAQFDVGGVTLHEVDPLSGVAILSGMLLRASAGSISKIRLRLTGQDINSVPDVLVSARLLPCPAGQGLLASGSCGACDPGTASAQDRSSQCLPCPEGSAVANSNSGSETLAGGSDRCFACPLGLHAPTAGLGLCLSCFDGFFSAPILLPDTATASSFSTGAGQRSGLVLARGATRCIPCPPRGVRCTSTGLSLEPGYFFPHLARATAWQAKMPEGIPSAELLQAVARGRLPANSSIISVNQTADLLMRGVLVSADFVLQDPVYLLKVSSMLQNTQTAVYPCWVPEACELDSARLDLSCADGYTGPLCGVCDSTSGNGFVRDGNGCVECLSEEGTWSLAALTLCAILGALGYVTVFHEFGDTSSQKVMIRVLLSHVQLLSAQSLLQLEGLQLVRSFLGVTSVASGSVSQLPQFSCLFPNFETGYYLGIATPFILAAAAVLLQFLAALWFSRCGKRQTLPAQPKSKAAAARQITDQPGTQIQIKSASAARAATKRSSQAVWAARQARTPWCDRLLKMARQRIRKAFIPPERLMSLSRFMQGSYIPPVVFILFLSYSSFVRATMAAFTCTVEVEGSQYLRADLRVVCGSTEHNVMLTVGTVLMLAGGIGAPLMFGYILFANRSRLNDPAMVSQFSFLYDGYSFDDGMYLWEMQILLLRKFLLVACAQLVSDPGLQLMSAILVVGASFFLTVAFLPYDSAMANNLELVSLGTALLTLVLSMSLLGTADLQTQEVDASGAAGLSREEADNVSTIMTVVLLLLNIGVLLFLIFHVVYPPPDVSTSHVISSAGTSRSGIAALMKRGMGTAPKDPAVAAPSPAASPDSSAAGAAASNSTVPRRGRVLAASRGAPEPSDQGIELLPTSQATHQRRTATGMVANPLLRVGQGGGATAQPAATSSPRTSIVQPREPPKKQEALGASELDANLEAQAAPKAWRRRRKSLFRKSVTTLQAAEQHSETAE